MGYLLTDYAGRDGEAPLFRVRLPTHVFASVQLPGFEGLPLILDGEQVIEFWVVPKLETALIGQDVLFQKGLFYEVSRYVLDNDAVVSFPMMLGPLVTPGDLQRPLNDAEDPRPVTICTRCQATRTRTTCRGRTLPRRSRRRGATRRRRSRPGRRPRWTGPC